MKKSVILASKQTVNKSAFVAAPDLGVDLDFVEAASEKEGAAHDEEQVAQDGPRLGGLTR